MSWRYLRATRANSGASVVAIISFIGIMLAVTALIVIMSIMSGFRTTLLDTLLSGDGHVTVTVANTSDTVSEAFAEELLQVEGVEHVFPRLNRFVLAQSDGGEQPALLRGVRMEDIDTLPYLDRGRVGLKLSEFGKGRNGGDTVFVGLFLAQKLRLIEGDTIKISTSAKTQTAFGGAPRSKTYKVGGILLTGSVELDQAVVLIPMEQGQILLQSKGRYDELDVRLDDFMNTEPIINEVLDRSGGQFPVSDWKMQREAYFNALQFERSMMRLIMLILVLITALNIITGVVMLVKNKTRDIAILRTIGASRSSMMRVFLMVGALLGLTGALIGLGLGSLIVLNIGVVENGINSLLGLFGMGEMFPATVYGVNGLPAELDWGEAVFVTVWAMATSVLVTLWPAWAAAKLDPVDALRFE